MRTPIRLSLIASLSIAGIGAAAANCDVSVWRWYVSEALRAQQNSVDQPPLLLESRASAIEPSRLFIHCNDRYLHDGSLTPMGHAAYR
jgi:hypothetical protein